MTSREIRNRIAQHPLGKPFTPALFAGLGSRAVIDQTLTRLFKRGEIDRIGHGLYLVPKVGRFGIKEFPTPEDIARVIAQSEGARIGIHGAEAARRLGLTTQISSQPIFYTTGSTRSIRIGNMRMKLQRVTARKLALSERYAGHALAALWYLGKEQASSSILQRIAERLPPEEFQALATAKSSMPSWMIELFREYEKNKKANV